MKKLKIGDLVTVKSGGTGEVIDIRYDFIVIRFHGRTYHYTFEGKYVRHDYSIPHKYDLNFKKRKLKVNLP